ncbi:hypothetical protein FA95DRAFT_1571322 [Auriscalpium vulgare]|uniref:Uncharacterized protein n=1 Tax=Auriscalpium vulgare TaxID=40419 RepID=A0ACB8RYS0_9AGAM|nr:hypothetical protein FA95DRAFT_1571322 [Auriscalpium vulgare]
MHNACRCGPCHQIAPAYDALSKQYGNVNFLKCDVDAAQEVAGKYSVSAMPTFIFLKGSTKVDQVRGADRNACLSGIETALRKHAGSPSAATSTPAAFTGKGHTLGGPSTSAPVIDTSAVTNLDPQVKKLLLFVGAYLIFWAAPTHAAAGHGTLTGMADSSSKAAPPPPPPHSRQSPPLVPEKYLDAPSQRLYSLSFGLLLQAIKLFDFTRYLLFSESSQTPSYGKKWLLVDLLYCVGLAQLRIPRLNYSKAMVIIQILSLFVVDGLLFGGIKLHLFGGSDAHDSVHDYAGAYSTQSTLSFSSLLSTLSLGLIGGEAYGNSDAHLGGQHIVRMSPISTAQLNPHSQTYCLPSPSSSVLIPVLLNNSNPSSLRYSITPLGHEGGKVPQVTLSAKDLKAIESSRQDSLQVSRYSGADRDKRESEYDEYDEDDDEDDGPRDPQRLQKTQSLVHIRLTKPGTVHLHAVHDPSGVEARIIYPSRLTVAPCPRAQFVEDDALTRGDNVRCASPGLGFAGADKDVQLGLSIYGVPPLSLKWYKEINKRREYFVVEGIESSHVDGASHSGSSSLYPAAQDVHVPLTLSAEALGTHTYVLESLTDALGNVENLAPSSVSSWLSVAPKVVNGSIADSSTKFSRTLHVLGRPKVSFKGCGPSQPTSLRVGSDVALQVAVVEADPLDGPWDVTVKYQPPTNEFGRPINKRLSPWQKAVKTNPDHREAVLKTTSPGEFTVLDVKGRYCEGDVLSPDTCKVVELARPTAEIEWRRIHECSGDTGVAASLVLHGTPPFSVYYRMQRDKEPPRELVKNFMTSRGEMTLQPPQSGHYIYSFSHLSDANYNKVELKGPSIDQIVHPLASASFVHSGDPGREKLFINSCSGNTVELETELRGTGPWNLDVQLVGPKGSEIISFTKIDTARKTLQLTIPKDVDREGGSFDVNIVSVEDSSGCKRSLSVPGTTVNVRRVKPTVKFYGKEPQRQITILEDEQASLPLRLTGEPPWRVKYRTRDQPNVVLTSKMSTPNGYLQVKEKGVYELVGIQDSQCPGTVAKDASTYRVDWVPRPSAMLSPDTEAKYEPYNGTYILPTICEGASGHVDLDLTGRPPFQIQYNIARATESGGTKLLDQPTFNSIQPRTRFQLHTAEPGRLYYEVKQVGDTAYPLSKHKAAIIPRSDRPLFEQEVLMRPSARFRSPNRLSYCLYDAFAPRDRTSSDGLVLLEGTPPFELTISVKNHASSESYSETITTYETAWKLDLSDHSFKTVGPHMVTIESVRDAWHCEQIISHPRERSIWVDVAESAAIVPFDRREHFCVGEAAQFQLEGIPPWTVGYRVNGKSHTQEAKVSPFSLALQQPGEFKITSIAHQQKMCKAVVTDLGYTVHSLPSAQVGQGKRIFQDIHEGDQAEIKFTLSGEPPFTFTYQRSELSTRKGGKPGKVLETHTVSGVTSNEYSIFSAMEGVWTVTFISDRHCRYPPVQDGNIDRA